MSRTLISSSAISIPITKNWRGPWITYSITMSMWQNHWPKWQEFFNLWKASSKNLTSITTQNNNWESTRGWRMFVWGWKKISIAITMFSKTKSNFCLSMNAKTWPPSSKSTTPAIKCLQSIWSKTCIAANFRANSRIKMRLWRVIWGLRIQQGATRIS